MTSRKSPTTDGTTGFSLSKLQAEARSASQEQLAQVSQCTTCFSLSRLQAEARSTAGRELAQVLQASECEQQICIGSVHRGRKDMFGIFTNDDAASGYTPILLDPHTTSPGQEGSAIVRNDQKDDGMNRESEIYYRARRIYYRGRRTSLRRGMGII